MKIAGKKKIYLMNKMLKTILKKYFQGKNKNNIISLFIFNKKVTVSKKKICVFLRKKNHLKEKNILEIFLHKEKKRVFFVSLEKTQKQSKKNYTKKKNASSFPLY
jgi:hypothetical protein